MSPTHTETDLPTGNKYPKLVRDKIPEIIKQNGKTAVTHVACDEEYTRHLLAKVVEEATELENAEGADHQREEIADVREVLDAIQTDLGISDEEIAAIQKSKADKRGGFSKRVILDEKP
jgi:predicted house-cleaning noncanonical NTP pyrophosphatase (MazG superfamily)